MAVLIPLIVLGLVIWLNWYLAGQFYDVAKMKGHRERKYFWLSFLLGMVGWLLVIALPDWGHTASAAADELPEL